MEIVPVEHAICCLSQIMHFKKLDVSIKSRLCGLIHGDVLPLLSDDFVCVLGITFQMFPT